MAKRTRYPDRNAARPAPKRAPSGTATRPSVRPAAVDEEPTPVDLADDAPMAASRAGLSDAEIDRAAQLEAEATARE
jgi:hypothetical protein